jgi:hypothetical protein
MQSRPKDKSTAVVARPDRVSLIVALGLVGLTVGGILTIFSAPLAAFIGR